MKSLNIILLGSTRLSARSYEPTEFFFSWFAFDVRSRSRDYRSTNSVILSHSLTLSTSGRSCFSISDSSFVVNCIRKSQRERFVGKDPICITKRLTVSGKTKCQHLFSSLPVMNWQILFRLLSNPLAHCFLCFEQFLRSHVVCSPFIPPLRSRCHFHPLLFSL